MKYKVLTFGISGNDGNSIFNSGDVVEEGQLDNIAKLEKDGAIEKLEVTTEEKKEALEAEKEKLLEVVTKAEERIEEIDSEIGALEITEDDLTEEAINKMTKKDIQALIEKEGYEVEVDESWGVGQYRAELIKFLF